MPILRTTALLVLAFALLAPRPAQAVRTEPEARRRVVELITQAERQPTLEDWRRIGPLANKLLIEIFQEGGQLPRVRLLALRNLAWFPSRRSRAFLGTLMNDHRAPADDRREAMVAFGRAFGAEALMDLRSFLRAPERTLREGAIRGIGAVSHSRARSLLDRHRSTEPDMELRLLTEEILANLPH